MRETAPVEITSLRDQGACSAITDQSMIGDFGPHEIYDELKKTDSQGTMSDRAKRNPRGLRSVF